MHPGTEAHCQKLGDEEKTSLYYMVIWRIIMRQSSEFLSFFDGLYIYI